MGSPGKDTIEAIQKTLQPYVRPREEVARIRQILALHLDSSLKDGTASGSLTLVDTKTVGPSSTARGLQNEYLEALSANIRARNEFDTCCHEERGSFEEVTAAEDQGKIRLQQHLSAIRLRQRHQRLEAVEGSLGSLAQKPAASPGFLDPEEIFKDSRPLPSIPRDLMGGLAVGTAVSGPRLKDLIDQLEKHVLQAKLLLRREEQLLEKVQSQSTASPEDINGSAKLDALTTTRSELINWIEAELSKAGDGTDAEGHDSHKHRASADINMDEQLASIKEKYAQYLDARKTLLQLVSQQPQPVMKPPSEKTEPPATSATTPPSSAHLISPYLSQLLSLAREQKGLIAQKSHLNATITKQLKENGQALNHLAQESQLIPAHPMPGARRTNAAYPDAISGTNISDPSDRVKPWVFAADSAKIATLETVAEKIEEGHIALEESMRTLGEIDELLGYSQDDGKEGESGVEEEDLWLAEGQPSGRTPGARRHTLRKPEKPVQAKTVWDKLDGNLGLLRSDRDGP
ncbi:hypothetical protein N0V88_004399 [Collariella sp. IMI 366227]|nr:hypothetical protein N0V88_004399 [Collariella sp. IMI 366227]